MWKNKGKWISIKYLLKEKRKRKSMKEARSEQGKSMKEASNIEEKKRETK